jgi:hypothetical protein
MNPQINFAFYQLFQSFIQFLHTFERVYFQIQQRDQINLIDLDEERWTEDSDFNPCVNNNWNEYNTDSGYSSDEINIQQQQIIGYKLINEYLQENVQINRQQYFLLSNEISNIDMRHMYDQGLNKGNCWNCSNEYSHICCAACKRITSECDCKYICGYTSPTGQKNKRGEYTQYSKCKYFTSNIDDVDHDCQGMIKEEHVILFVNETETKRFKQDNISRKPKCYRCKQEGHFSRDCTNFTCYKCNEKGHIAKDCIVDYNNLTGWDY